MILIRILFQKICITDICIIIKKPMAFGEQLLTSDLVSNQITSPMACGENMLTSNFVLNQTIFYLDLF